MLENEIMDSGADEPSMNEATEVDTDQTESKVENPSEDAAEDYTEADADSDQTEEPEVAPTVKVEYDGKEYDLAPEIKDALMRNKDYTEKTQSLGDQRREFEASQAQFKQMQEAQQAHSEKLTDLAMIDRQLSQYQGIDWNAAFDQDFETATKLNVQAQQLQAQRNQLVQEIDQAEKGRQSALEQQLAQTASKTDKAMGEMYSNWGEAKQELGSFAVETLGFPAEAVRKAVTKQEMNALYLAQIGWKTLQKVQKEAKAKQPEPAKQPSKTVKPKRNAAPKDLSKISDPEAYREARMRQKRAKG